MQLEKTKCFNDADGYFLCLCHCYFWNVSDLSKRKYATLSQNKERVRYLF